MKEKLFPEYLNKGSRGAAVFFLQNLLLAGGYNSTSIFADGIYGEETAKGVCELQEELGVETDGHFGPTTRSVWLHNGGPDIDSITMDSLTSGTEAIMP